MRRVCYLVAASLDGYIAGPGGEFDGIPADPGVDFSAIFARFDTVLAGRRTFEAMVRQGQAVIPGMRTIVFSRTLRPADHPGVTVVADDPAAAVGALRSAPGKDVWLFGGGLLFRTLLNAGVVDTVEVAVAPILLGGGAPLLPPPADRVALRLTGTKTYGTGIVALEYAVAIGPG